jgi:hypothetical protein
MPLLPFSASTSFAKILARLGVRGAVHDVTGAPAGRFDRAVPVLGGDNRLHPSVLPPGSVGATPYADEVEIVNPNSGAGPLEGNESATNVHEALENITKDVDGLAVMRAKNLTDLADTDEAFHHIKVPAVLVTGSNPPADQVSGVVSLALDAEITSGAASRVEADGAGAGGNDTDVPLFLHPGQLRQFYVNRFDTTPQAMAGTITVPDTIAVFQPDELIPKRYLDEQLGQLQAILTANTVWVDQSATLAGVRGVRNRPFATLTAGLAAAQSGDLIVVGPGSYNETGLQRSGTFTINWLFLPGAEIRFTGSAVSPIFTVVSGQTWNIAGDGVFANYGSGGGGGRVFQVSGDCTLVCACRHILSNDTPVLVNTTPDDSRVNRFLVSGDIRADNLAGGGGMAMYLATGHCDVRVAGEIWSGASAAVGLNLGQGNGTVTGSRITVRAGRITGRNNALNLQSADNPQVTADSCHATNGPAVFARANSRGTLSARLITCAAASNPVVRVLAGGQLRLTGGRVSALQANQHAVEMLGDTYVQSRLVLDNVELFRNGSLTGRCLFSQTPLNTVRIVGNVHADDSSPGADPVTAILLGGFWSVINTADF